MNRQFCLILEIISVFREKKILLKIFHIFFLTGQVIFALGGLLDSYPVMQAGRFVFGIGGESLAVAQNTYAVSWFKGKELNMVFGFQVRYTYNICSKLFWFFNKVLLIIW